MDIRTQSRGSPSCPASSISSSFEGTVLLGVRGLAASVFFEEQDRFFSVFASTRNAASSHRSPCFPL